MTDTTKTTLFLNEDNVGIFNQHYWLLFMVIIQME